MNISSQISQIENRLSRIRLSQQPPTLSMVLVQVGEQIPQGLTQWDLPLVIEPKRI